MLIRPELISEWKETLRHTSDRFGMKTRKQAVLELFNEFYELSDKKRGI